MKYLRRFTSKEDYKNDVIPQVSVVSNEVMFDSTTQVVNIANLNTNLKNLDKDYLLSGIIENKVLNISGKSASLQNAAVTGNIDKIESNTAVSMNEMETIEITNSYFDASTYNMLEIGLSGDRLPNIVNITNCDFGTMTNNTITIFGYQDNAVINIKDCYFESVSNALRISNRTGAKNLTVNIENCTCDKWESGEYAGFLLLQEYPLGQNNFSDVTINITNLVGPNGLVTGTPETVCGTKDDNQVIYLYTDSVQDYNSNIYPKININ